MIIYARQTTVVKDWPVPTGFKQTTHRKYYTLLSCTLKIDISSKDYGFKPETGEELEEMLREL